MLSVADARRAVLDAIAGPLGTEDVPIDAALGRVLGADLTAAGDVPPFANSAMDGYALRSGPGDRDLRIVDESRAGSPAQGSVGDGEAVRISTGAVVPAGADAVVRVEDTREEEGSGTVHVAVAVERGRNVREPGEDVRAGTTVLRAGTPLGPVELAVAVTAGRGGVPCVRRPRVGVLATGDELVAPGATLGPGEIHNSNEPMLAGLAERAGAVVTIRGRIPDDRARTESELAAALEASDLLVVSGGVSVGPHDHVKPALTALGVEESFWRVALQPGKPTWFGTRGNRFVFGLPGNPVSAAVCFTLFAAPALRVLQGREPLPARRTARLEPPVPRRSDREQAIRVRLSEADGGLVATANGPQGSHVLTSLLGADALAFVPAGEDAAGEAEIEAL